MKPLSDIIADAVDGDEFDLSVAIETATSELQASSTYVTPAMSIEAAFEAQNDVNLYIGQLVLQIADEVGALPNGFETELETFATFLQWSRIKALYEAVEAVRASQSGLVIPTGEVPPLEGPV